MIARVARVRYVPEDMYSSGPGPDGVDIPLHSSSRRMPPATEAGLSARRDGLIYELPALGRAALLAQEAAKTRESTQVEQETLPASVHARQT